MNKTICLVLLFSLVFSVSCAKDPKKNPDVQSIETPDEESLFENLPEGDYENYEFRFLNNISNYAITTLVPEDISDTVDSAMHARNRFTEQKLGVKLSETRLGYDEGRDVMIKIHESGDFVYDAVFNEVWSQVMLSTRGILMPTSDYGNLLGLNNPWWYGNAMESLRVCGNLYYVAGDLHLMYYDSIWGIAFNRPTFEKFSLEYPYEKVRNGIWTLDDLYEIACQTQPDGANTHYGLVSHITFSSAMLAACGIKLVETSSDGTPVMREIDDKFVDVYTDVMNDFFSDNGDNLRFWICASYNSNTYKDGYFDMSKTWQERFIGNQSTFMAGTVGDMRMARASEFDYGIIPMPKYSENQEKYVSYVFEGAATCGIPSESPDIERTCTVLENLSAYSYKLVKPRYYNITLQGRLVRDPDSVEMLDIIFGHTDFGLTSFELDNVYKFGLSKTIQIAISDCSTSIASEIKKNKSKTEAAIKKSPTSTVR